MKVKTMPNGSVSFAKVLLFCGIMLGLMAALPAAAQGEKLTRIVMPMNDTIDEANEYAELVYALPSETNIEADVLEILDYTDGKVIKAPLYLNGSKVTLHLLYPCQAPQVLLEPAALKSLLYAYDPIIMQANFSDSLLGISGLPAIWGQVGGQMFTSYQPTNQTVALIVMDMGLSEATMATFLGNLSINLIEGATPLTPGYCPDTTVATTAAPVETAAQNDTAAAQNDTAATLTAETTAPAEPREETLLTGREKMVADMQAAREKLAAAREKMRG